jgi:hypothetical protein
MASTSPLPDGTPLPQPQPPYHLSGGRAPPKIPSSASPGAPIWRLEKEEEAYELGRSSVGEEDNAGEEVEAGGLGGGMNGPPAANGGGVVTLGTKEDTGQLGSDGSLSFLVGGYIALSTYRIKR